MIRVLTTLAFLALVTAQGTGATADIPPDPLNSAELRNYGGPGPLSLFNVPDGSGRAFDEAFAPGGGSADATITVTIRDHLDTPVEFFPLEDIWLESVPAPLQRGLIACHGNVTADANTDALGETIFADPLFAGGQSTTDTYVVVSGTPITDHILPIRVNSADIDGDGVVNLTDGGFFVEVLFGGYDYTGDFNNDGMVNVSDAGFVSAALGARCPSPMLTDSLR